MESERLKKLIAASLILALAVFMTFSLIRSIKAAEPSEPHPGNAIWLEPSSKTIDINTATVGDKFNVTVWLNLTEASYTWQVKIFFNNTYFNATQTKYTAGSTSDFFTGHPIIPVTPIINNQVGFVLHGESLLGFDEREAGYGSLVWVEFELIEVPPENHLTINFSLPYGEDTFVMNPDLDMITVENMDGTDIPVIPEFAQLLLLLMATLTTTGFAVLAKKLRR